MTTIISTLSCDNCCSVDTPGNLVSSILLHNEYGEFDGGTRISISAGLSSLFSYWVGVPIDDDKKTEDNHPFLHFCPECALIFRDLYKISVQFLLKLGRKESQVAKRLAELRVLRSARGQGRDLRNQNNEEEIQIKIDPGELDLDIKEEDDGHVSTGTDDHVHFGDDGINETPAFGEIQLETGDNDDDYEADDFAIDPLKLSGDESSSTSDYSPSSSSSNDPESDTEPAPSNPLKCSVCFKTFASRETKDRHFRQQHDETFTPLPCPADNCDLTFKRWDQLKAHLTRQHPDVPVPPAVSRWKPAHIKNKKQKEDDLWGNRVPCLVPTCDKTYSANGYMYAHMRTAHPDVPFKMQRFQKGSQEAFENRWKSKNKPKSKDKAPCPICGKEVRKHFMNTHIKTHSEERNHLCNTCGKTFRTSRYLRLHIDHVHIAERKYSCELCTKTFVRKYEYQYHIRYVHEKTQQTWICETCGKTFGNPAALRQHKKTHSDQEFKCPHCDKVSNCKTNIQRHVNWVHKGKKRVRQEKKKGEGRRLGRPPDDARVRKDYQGGEGSQNNCEQE